MKSKISSLETQIAEAKAEEAEIRGKLKYALYFLATFLHHFWGEF